MTSTARTSIIAIATLIVGGVIGYGYNASLPVSVTSTDVATDAPFGNKVLTEARTGILHLDDAAAAIGKGDLAKAENELSGAKASFDDVKKEATDKTQPIRVAQEAVIIHQFAPSPDFEAVGAVGKSDATAAGMALTKGWKTKPLALSDYSISFGDLAVETDFATTHIDLAVEAAKGGNKADAAKQIKEARRAITFTFSGDNIEGKQDA